MEHLEELYEELAPAFNKLRKKREEVDDRIRELETKLEAVEDDLELSKVEKLTTKLSAAKKVRNKIDEKWKKLIGDDREQNQRINWIQHAHREDWAKENAAMQPKFEEVEELRNKANEILKEIEEHRRETYLKHHEMTSKFAPFVTPGKSVQVTNAATFSNFYPKEDE